MLAALATFLGTQRHLYKAALFTSVRVTCEVSNRKNCYATVTASRWRIFRTFDNNDDSEIPQQQLKE
jgi:hypothetical protein